MVGLGVPPQDTILLIFVWIALLLSLEEDHMFKQALIATSGALTDVYRPPSLLLTKATQNLIADPLSVAAYAFAFVAVD